MVKLKPKLMKHRGKQVVVLPYKAYCDLQDYLEDMEGFMRMDKAIKEGSSEPGIPIEDLLIEMGLTREGLQAMEDAGELDDDPEETAAPELRLGHLAIVSNTPKRKTHAKRI